MHSTVPGSRTISRRSLGSVLQQRWISSLGVQSWLLDAARQMLSDLALRLSCELSIDPVGGNSVGASLAESPAAGISSPGATVVTDIAGRTDPAAGGESSGSMPPTPQTVEGVRMLIAHLRDTLEKLDDVEQYSLVGEVDNDMYYLWKELERKMQRHRQSEARLHLKDMFRL